MMTKAIFFLTFASAAFSARADEAAKPIRQCELVEKALLLEISSDPRTIEDHIRIAKINRTLSRIGCAENQANWAVHAKASLDIAKALIDITIQDKEESRRLSELIRAAE